MAVCMRINLPNTDNHALYNDPETQSTDFITINMPILKIVQIPQIEEQVYENYGNTFIKRIVGMRSSTRHCMRLLHTNRLKSLFYKAISAFLLILIESAQFLGFTFV